MKQILKLSVISVILVTLTSLIFFGTAQQMLRLGVNDVPVQIATDAINKLNNGARLETMKFSETVEISESLSPYVIILDQDKKVLASSATLYGKPPAIPSGIFDYVAKKGQERVTWQPARGIRQAIVVYKYRTETSSGFVVAGRSLTETENLIDKIGKDILIGWSAINVFTVASIVFSRRKTLV